MTLVVFNTEDHTPIQRTSFGTVVGEDMARLMLNRLQDLGYTVPAVMIAPKETTLPPDQPGTPTQAPRPDTWARRQQEEGQQWKGLP